LVEGNGVFFIFLNVHRVAIDRVKYLGFIHAMSSSVKSREN
jgi:hypothetical protein